MKSSVASTLLVSLMLAAPSASNAGAASPQEIVNAYAKSLVDRGEAVGVGVAVISGTGEPTFYTFGKSVVSDGTTASRPFREDSLFEIGSVTKVFTTNLLGQAVYANQVALGTTLSNYTTQLGALQPLTSQVTLLDLADFTAGMPTYAPLCARDEVPGCLPSGRPTIQQYTAGDFAKYFGSMVPLDFTKKPPTSASTLPAPYNYSDYAIGLLGLLLSSTDAPLGNADLHRWYQKVHQGILEPLGMKDTFLFVPPDQTERRAGGYQQALATATVSNGQVSAITLTSHGALYKQAPQVRIVGGGGTGAQATANLAGNRVSGITLTNGGSGYLQPAQVVFNNGGSSVAAKAHVVVQDGHVIAVAITGGGKGYARVPTVTIRGGRNASGRDAKATAHLVNGRVGYVTIDDPGAGYVQPVGVMIDPGAAIKNTVPIWAAAGALKTSLRDLASFSRAALLSPRAAEGYPAALAHGFQLSETPYACTGATPALASCPQGAMQSAMSWAVQPADSINGVPQVIMKGGGLPGFSTYVSLMPDVPLAVVVMVNSRSPGLSPGQITLPIEAFANNILYALYASRAESNGARK